MAVKRRRARIVTSRNVKIDSPAFKIVEAFGGLQRLCDATGWAPGTVHGWLVSGTIPQWRRDHIVASAQRLKIVLSTQMLTDPEFLGS